MLLLIDHRGPFLHNLIHAFAGLGAQVKTTPHDEMSLDDIDALGPRAIVLSSGLTTDLTTVHTSVEVIQAWAQRIPILGIGLGMHCIGAAFGGQLKTLDTPVIGKASDVYHDQRGLFQSIASPMTVTRYDRAIVDDKSLPPELQRSAWDQDGDVLGFRHRDYLTFGVQFHPESIGTTGGIAILEAFVKLFERRD